MSTPMEKEKIKKNVDKAIRLGIMSKRKLNLCANYPDCYNERARGSKFCDECSIDYRNEHKDDNYFN